MFLKKVVSSSRNSNKCSRTFPQDNCYNSVSGRKVLCVFSTSSYSIQSSFISDSLRPHGLSTPGFPVHHQLSEFAQTHVHRVGDAMQPSHPLWSPSPPAFNIFQHQGLLQLVSSSHQVAKVLEFQLQHQSFQRIFRTDFL